MFIEVTKVPWPSFFGGMLFVFMGVGYINLCNTTRVGHTYIYENKVKQVC